MKLSTAKSSRAARVRLGVEQLGERLVPAGSVTGVVANGSLFLTGDGEDNTIEIRKGLTQIRIHALDGTTINGAGFVDFVGVFKDVFVNLKGGDDVLHLEGGGGGTAAAIGRDLIFFGGDGDDSLTSEADAAIGRDLIFAGGTGLTSATLDGVDIGRNARFGGAENVNVQTANNTWINGVLSVKSPLVADVTLDVTTMGLLNVAAGQQLDANITSSLVGGNAVILGGLGVDSIDMSLGNEILGNLAIRTRSGDDAVDLGPDVGGNLLVNLGTGANQTLETGTMIVYGNLTFASVGPGLNDWDIDDLTVMGTSRFFGGDGADTIVFDNCEFLGAVNVSTGKGGDVVAICDGGHVYFRGATLIDLGDGADVLQLGDGGIGEANFDFQVTLLGGAGDDLLNDLNTDFDQSPQTAGF
jgi:hypothetical protein